MLTLAACGDNKARFIISPPETASQTRVRVASIEVRDVSLPAYATGTEIVVEDDDGALRPVRRAIWADDPPRAVTGALAASLDRKSTAIVAAEPWPLTESPDVQLSVRVDQMVARTDGTFRLSGQFALSSPSGATRDRLDRFSISVPLPDTEPASVAVAAGNAIDGLADAVLGQLKR